MKKTKILALGLAMLMGLAPITACSQATAAKAPSPGISIREQGRGRKRRRGPAGKALDDLHHTVGRSPLTSAWITSLKSIRLR